MDKTASDFDNFWDKTASDFDNFWDKTASIILIVLFQYPIFEPSLSIKFNFNNSFIASLVTRSITLISKSSLLSKLFYPATNYNSKKV